jgi:hypothetical protein
MSPRRPVKGRLVSHGVAGMAVAAVTRAVAGMAVAAVTRAVAGMAVAAAIWCGRRGNRLLPACVGLA